MTFQTLGEEAAIRTNSFVIVAASLSAALVIAPSLMSIIAYASNSYGVVFESSVFSADYAHLFLEILYGHAVWHWGQYGINLVNYLPLFLFHWALEGLLGNKLVAYHVIVMLAQVAALGAFVALCETWMRRYSGADDSVFGRISAWLLGAVFLTSLANFNYLKSNILFALPYYSLPIQLLLIERYLTSRNRREMLGLTVVVLMMNTFNLTHFVYIQGAVLGYSYFSPFINYRQRTVIVDWRAAAWAGLAIIPAAILVAGAWVVNLPYYGSLSELGNIMTEGMYSQNTSILNGLLQTTDWGLFGQFNGELYYEYSPYYLYTLSKLMGLILPAVVIVLLLLSLSKKDNRPTRLVLFFGLIALVCLFFIPGEKNPLFSWLYENIFLFRVFRNITKLSPMLIFSLVALVFLLSRGNGLRTAKRYALGIAIVGALAYNLPYWLYADYFFRDRSVREIPQYWHDTGDFLANHALPGSRVLMLPPTYINDIYFWDNKKNWVQGNLADAIWSIRTFRLSEVLIGPPRMQREMKETFEARPSLPRGISVDYNLLESFARNNGFDFLVLTRDLVDDYHIAGSFEPWTNRAGFTKLAEFGAITVFHNPENRRPPLIVNHEFSYSRIDHLTYRLTLKNVRGPVSLEFHEEFRPGWRLAADAHSDVACSERCPPTPLFFHFYDIVLGSRDAHFSDKHFTSANGSNKWALDTSVLLSRLPPESIHENADGSSDISLLIHFVPQLYFIIMIWVFIASLVVCILSFCFSSKSR